MESIFSTLACVLCAYLEPPDGKSLLTVSRDVSESVVQCARKRIELGRTPFETVIFKDITKPNGESCIAVTYKWMGGRLPHHFTPDFKPGVAYFKPNTDFQFKICDSFGTSYTMLADIRVHFNMWYTYDEVSVETPKDLEILRNAWQNFVKTRK